MISSVHVTVLADPGGQLEAGRAPRCNHAAHSLGAHPVAYTAVFGLRERGEKQRLAAQASERRQQRLGG